MVNDLITDCVSSTCLLQTTYPFTTTDVHVLTLLNGKVSHFTLLT